MINFLSDANSRIALRVVCRAMSLMNRGLLVAGGKLHASYDKHSKLSDKQARAFAKVARSWKLIPAAL